MARRDQLRLLAIPAVVAGLFALAGNPRRSLVVLGLAVVAAIAIVAGVPVDRGIRRLGGWIGNVLYGGLFVLVVIPTWALTARGRRKGRPAGFHQHLDAPRPRSMYTGAEHARAPRGPLAAAWRAVGVVVIILGINYAVGYGWEKLLDPPPAPAAVPDRLGVQAEGYRDPRVDAPAMAAYPWRERYFAEMASVPIRYWPYLSYRSGTFAGRYVNIDGWTRRSYRPTDGGAMPVVDFYGGSKIWGEGQRDGYTIASMVARYAEAAGIPIQVHNHGQRGWVNWQEMLLFEQLTANTERPDLAVFYDGSNDVNAQLGPVRGQPTTTNAQELSDVFQQTISERQRIPDASSTPDDASIGGLLRQLMAKYDERSALHRLLGSEAAGASPAVADRAVDNPTLKPPSAADVPEVTRATREVYARGRELIEAIAASRGIEPVFFLERQITRSAPEGAPKAAFARYRQILDGLVGDPGVIDVAAVLDDHQDTYIDPGHTNEQGAALVARAMFEQLEPQLRAWYAAHP